MFFSSFPSDPPSYFLFLLSFSSSRPNAVIVLHTHNACDFFSRAYCFLSHGQLNYRHVLLFFFPLACRVFFLSSPSRASRVSQAFLISSVFFPSLLLMGLFFCFPYDPFLPLEFATRLAFSYPITCASHEFSSLFPNQ